MNGYVPRHCAALQDRVAILACHKFSNSDKLYVSTDLRSWKKIILPYQYMSLATYQSKFVLVGGRHPSSHESTNILLTSATGLQWKNSLPPMRVERYNTSSVSTRSPEALVVAGGCVSYGAVLDVIEVLLGDGWITVDSLPAPDCGMHSTLHEGNLHFTRGPEQGATGYTCSCSSLISSVLESTSTTSTDRPLWKQYQAPDEATITVSYCSQLANIDGRGSVRALSNTTQSWVEANTAGDIHHDVVENIAAAVLTSPVIVYAHEYGGVYRGTLTGKNCNCGVVIQVD